MGGFSEKLNGYWEEGYHYYLEFRDGKLTVRRYDRVFLTMPPRWMRENGR